MKISSSSALVTGGASGMGAATAKRLRELGANVAIFDINREAAEKIAKELECTAISCNITDANNVEAAIHQAVKTLGDIHIVVNCAGILHTRRMVNKQGAMPIEEFRNVIDVNLIGTFNVMKSAAAFMMQTAQNSNERGVIINTASIAAFEGQIGQTAYGASKAAIVGLTLPAARELAKFGIRVMAIAPGLVDTPMFQQLSEEARANLYAAVPFPKRLAYPEEYALLVQQIIENPMLNGEVIRLDGGLRLQ